MATRAEVGDRRKRRDGHTWQKVGKGKWKRVSKAERKKKRERAKAKVGEKREKREKRAESEHISELTGGSTDPAVREAAKKDGPGLRDHGDLNEGDTIKIPGRVGDVEVLRVDRHGDPPWSSTVTFMEPHGDRNHWQVETDKKIERVDQKQTNVQRVRKGVEAHSKEVMDLATHGEFSEIYDKAFEEKESAIDRRYFEKASRGKGEGPSPDSGDPRHPIRIREREVENHVINSLDRGDTIGPKGDIGKHEMAAVLRDLEDDGYVSEEGGTYELTPLGRDRVEGDEWERQERRRRAGKSPVRELSEEEKKKRRREYAERYRRKKGKRKQRPTSEEDLGAMVSEAQAALERRREKRIKGKK